MSRILATLIVGLPLISAPALAQEVYGPAEEYEGDEDTPEPLTESQPCETETQEDGVILVCRELTDSERYMSPLPKPTQSDRVIIPGLTDPPCWVVPRGGTCIRFGYAPEPALIIDVEAFPEPLSAVEAALVTEIETVEDEAETAMPLRPGRRIPIDISEDD